MKANLKTFFPTLADRNTLFSGCVVKVCPAMHLFLISFHSQGEMAPL